MDSETLKKLDSTGVAILEKLGEATTSGIELFEKEAPQLCTEIIAVGRAYNTILVSLGIFFFILSIYVIKNACKRLKISVDQDKNFPPNPTNVSIVVKIFISILSMIISFIMVSSKLYTLCLVYFAPRLYLIEYISYLFKK